MAKEDLTMPVERQAMHSSLLLPTATSSLSKLTNPIGESPSSGDWENVTQLRHWSGQSSPEQGYSVVHGLETGLSRKSQAETKALAYLRRKRLHRSSASLLDDLNTHHSHNHSLYIMNDADIVEAVDIMIKELKKSISCSDDTGTVKQQLTTGKMPVLPQLNCIRKSITPQISAAADPATTISMPKTYFTHTNWLGVKGAASELELDTSTRATIMSRSSIADVLWSDNSFYPSNMVSESRLTKPDRRNSREAENRPINNVALSQPEGDVDYLSHHHSNSPALATRGTFRKRLSRSTDEESNMTSFPELRPRHCTNDWLNPPVEIDQLNRIPATDLYHRGVDAHSGIASPKLSEVWKDARHHYLHCDHSLFDKDPFCGTSTYMYERRRTDASNSTSRRRLGSSIGTSSHRRRSSQVPMSSTLSGNSRNHSLDKFLDEVRTNSQYIFDQQIFSPADADIHGFIYEEEMDRFIPKTGTRSRDSIVRERPLQPPVADCSGIYEAMTGSIKMGTTGRNTCSEDYCVQACDNDADSVIRGTLSPA